MATSVYTRINGDMIKQYRGHTVCLLGKLKKLAGDQCSFEIETCDYKQVTIKVKSPIKDMLSDIVEVYGSVDEKGAINCVNYATFEPNAIQNFDMDLYNEAIKVMHSTKHYIQSS